MSSCAQLSRDHHIWLEVGHYTNNTLRYIDVDKIHDYLGDRIYNVLPALRIFDYTAAFNKKGKVKPLKLLQDNVDSQNAFSALGSEEVVEFAIQDVIYRIIRMFVVYPTKESNKVS